jgi:hypothetical protein
VTTSSREGAAAAVQRVFEAGQRLPDKFRTAIVAQGTEAVPLLIRLLDNDQLDDFDAPGGGWAPLHAAALLGELRAVDAIPVMLRRLAGLEYDTYLYSGLIHALSGMGEAVIEPVLAAHAASSSDDYRGALVDVLTDAGVHDDRILAILLDELRADPSTAGYLASYDDPRALPALHRAFDEYVVVEDESPLANHALVELAAAIEELGGELTEAEAAKHERGRAAAERWRQALEARRSTPALRAERPGRNDACWCGTGTKYKKCHLRSDEDGSTAPPSPS